MELILHFIGFIWVAIGSIQIMYTDKSRSVLQQVISENGYRVVSAPPLLIGVLLVIAAFWSKVFLFVFPLGALVLAHGLFILLGPSNKGEAVVKFMFVEASDELFRLRGIFFLILGTAILASA